MEGAGSVACADSSAGSSQTSPDGVAASAYGVRRGLLGKLSPVKRTTFVIDTDRRILEVIASELRASVHADRALDALRAR